MLRKKIICYNVNGSGKNEINWIWQYRQEKSLFNVKRYAQKEWDFENKVINANYDEFLNIYDEYLKEEYSDFPIKRYVLINEYKYLGYIALKLSKDINFINKGSPIFYKINL